MRAAIISSLLCVSAAVASADGPAPARDPSGDRKVRLAPQVPPVRIESKAVSAEAAPRRSKEAEGDASALLGGWKALDVRDGEAVVRIDGVEKTLRPGMPLGSDVVRSITGRRMVLLRPERVDPKKGETLIIVEFVGPGRTRVRSYSTRDWTARAPRRVE